MTNTRLIAVDALFMVIYIGLAAALVGSLAALAGLYAASIEMGALHTAAGIVSLLGLAALPLMPRLYRRLTGQRFSWRSNGALGGFVEN